MSIRAKIIIVVSLLGGFLVALATADAVRVFALYRHNQAAVEINLASQHLLTAAGYWALERGMTSGALGADNAPSASLTARIASARESADREFELALKIIEAHGSGKLSQDISTAQTDHDYLKALRKTADTVLAENRRENREVFRETFFQRITQLITDSQVLRSHEEEQLDNHVPGHTAIAFSVRHNLWVASEFAGRERGMVVAKVGQADRLTVEELVTIGNYRGHFETGLDRAATLQDELSSTFKNQLWAIQDFYRNKFTRLRNIVLGTENTVSDHTVTQEEWFEAATQGIAAILEAQRTASADIEAGIDEAVNGALLRLFVDIALVAIALGIFAGALLIIHRQVINPLDKIRTSLTELATGNLDVDVPFRGRRDEVGAMADAVVVFKQYAERIRDLEKAQYDARKRAEEAQEQAEQAAAAKSTFLANMSHEVRTPLNGILGLGRLLGRTELTAKQHDYIQKILSSGELLLTVINDILDISKIESGRLEFETIDFNLDRVMNSLADLWSDRMQDKNLEVLFHVDPETPLDLIGDPTRLQQVLVNLCSNALKFTEAGEIVVSVRPQQISREQTTLEFSVRDTGIGMSEDETAKLFTPFTQADTSTTRKFGGTGLGLAISKNLVERMHGEIWVESEPGTGSTFTFTADFPLAPKDMRKRVEFPPNLQNLEVLIVDDSETARIIMSEALRAMGFATDMADSGEAALQAIQKRGEDNPYDVILIDYAMPGMNGVELASRIDVSDTTPPKPLMMLISALASTQIPEAQDGVGIAAHLTKPFNQSSLFNALVRAFSRTAGGDERSYRRDVASEAEEQAKGLRILLAEDNEINRHVVLSTLYNAGAECEVARTGRQAFEKVLENPPGYYSAVLMDIQMPELDGFAATKLIRELPDYDDLPIIAMTAHAMETERRRCLDAGMQDHIAKPFQPNRLFEVLAKYCAGRRLPTPRRKHPPPPRTVRCVQQSALTD